jgi:putative ABC transport system permease protein
VKDYHYTRLEAPIGPMLLYYRPERFNYVNVRLAPGDPKAALAALEATWKQFGAPFTYRFYDEQMAEEYAIYEDAVAIFGLAAFFAILIACLGLFGMATYTVETRTKEVGVRKVMGANVPGLVALLSKDFFKLVVIALVIAGPMAWFVNNLWLQQFALQAPLDAWIFGPAVLAVFALAALTIGSQTLRAARANPVDTLRYE